MSDDDVPDTGRSVKLYVPQSPGALWSIGVDRFPKSRPNGHPDLSWSAVWWGCEIRMPEDYLRSFVKHAAATLGMGPDEFVPVPPLPPVEIDCETVPVAVCGLPEFAEPTTAVEPKTERWAR